MRMNGTDSARIGGAPIWSGRCCTEKSRGTEERRKETETMEEKSCETCAYGLGGGYNNCRLNLEAECAAGEYEAWEDKGE